MAFDIKNTKLPNPDSTETEKYYQYLNFIFDELTYIKSAFELYIHVYNKRTTVEDLAILNISPAFWGMVTDALLNNSVIKLCKLYDSNTDTITISKFIKFISSNATKIFNAKNIYEITTLISNDTDLIQTKAGFILKLKELRDKSLAHNDKKLFQINSSIWSKVDLKIGDIRMLIDTCADIVNNYVHFSDETFQVIEFMNSKDIDKTLDIIKKYKLEPFQDYILDSR